MVTPFSFKTDAMLLIKSSLIAPRFFAFEFIILEALILCTEWLSGHSKFVFVALPLIHIENGLLSLFLFLPVLYLIYWLFPPVVILKETILLAFLLSLLLKLVFYL